MPAYPQWSFLRGRRAIGTPRRMPRRRPREGQPTPSRAPSGEATCHTPCLLEVDRASALHLPVALLTRAVGGNSKELKIVGFRGSSEAITSLMGEHVKLVPTAAGNAAPHVATGKLHIVGVAAPKRFSGVLANAPTWQEQGVDLVWGGWRAIVGPKGMTAAHVTFWESVLRRATQAPEWKTDLEKNFWSDDFATGEALRKDLEKDYASMKSVLVDLGLAKQ